MMIDKDTRNAIADVVKQAQMEANELYNERYVTANELCNQIAMFTKNWLDVYGHKLPRERITVTGDDGKSRSTRWGYPLHAIQRMIAEGKLRNIRT